jgi:hypothetical protein
MSYHIYMAGNTSKPGEYMRVGNYELETIGESKLEATDEVAARLEFADTVERLAENDWAGEFVLVHEDDDFEGAGNGRYSVIDSTVAGESVDEDDE